MKCPACRLPLVTLEIEGVEVDYCADDLGVWFDAGEIAALLHGLPAVLRPDGRAPRGRRRCPRCGGKMVIHRPVPELELDVCALGDGMWLDAGEVGKLAALSASTTASVGAAELERLFAQVTRMTGGHS